MKTIIVPTDFSAVALNAINYAIALAKDTQSRILLFHAYQIPVTFSEVPLVTISIEELQKESANRLEELRRDVDHVASGMVPVTTENVLGDPVEELERLCGIHDPLLVIMGTKGAGALERMIIGSTTLSAMKKLSAPVLIVPPGAMYKTIHKIGFACDFTDVKETVPVDGITDIVGLFKASLHVLNVDYKEKHFSGDTTIESTGLHEMLNHLQPSYHYINSVDVEEGINAFSDANHIDLLITVPKKHRFWENIFRKSHSDDLVLHSHLPIIALHH